MCHGEKFRNWIFFLSVLVTASSRSVSEKKKKRPCFSDSDSFRLKLISAACNRRNNSHECKIKRFIWISFLRSSVYLSSDYQETSLLSVKMRRGSSNFFCLIMETTVLLGTFHPAEMFMFPRSHPRGLGFALIMGFQLLDLHRCVH